jgi:type II secretory pathway pseudopilin PulG
LVEMMVVIAIMLALAALAAAFAPRVNDNQKLTRAVDNLEQYLLTAKMRAKRDGLATGLRFITAPGDIPGVTYSQFQYIQQPPPLSGGIYLGTSPSLPPGYPTPYQYPAGSGIWFAGGLLLSAAGGTVTFAQVVSPGPIPAAGTIQGVDFTLGGLPPNQYLVQTGDYLEINGGGVYAIGAVTTNTLTLANAATLGSYDNVLTITSPTTNYRIIRQPRLLIGEEPVALPNNYAANFGFIPGILPLTSGCNVLNGFSGFPEILFSPTGAVIGTNAGTPILWISVWDVPAQMQLPDSNNVGIVGIQSRSGFIGAYNVSLSGNPFLFVQTARESGL